MNLNLDSHLITIIVIMILSGGFGGYLNYLHNFDTVEKDQKNAEAEFEKSIVEKDQKNKIARFKYILLGIGAALLVPVFLQMISSNLANSKENNDYLIFGGFCLIAAIFSRRFITTIGERILEVAKNAEKKAEESIQIAEEGKQKAEEGIQRIETESLSAALKNIDPKESIALKDMDIQESMRVDEGAKSLLSELSNSYIENTSVPDYSHRLRLKAELGRKMGEIIVRNNFLMDELLRENKSEGILLALAYSVQLKPDKSGVITLNKISNLAYQSYTKYSILVAYDSLARNILIDKEHVREIYKIVKGFRNNADKSLRRKIDDTLNILSFIEPEQL